jgi:hypothetical protein
MAISINVVGSFDDREIKRAQKQLNTLAREAEKSAKSQMSGWEKTSGAIDKYDKKMTVAGLAVVAGLGLSARAAEEANQANARLEQVFRSMGDASGEGAAQAEAQADSLSRLIGVDDEVIKGAQAKLATFSAVSDEVARQNGIFERATQASANLAATGFGDMASASVMLGKALQDPVKGITAMTRVGVTFTAAEKEKIKTLVESGNTLEAQRVILGAVEKQVGGVAEASATSSARFKVSAGEFQEAIGQQVLPAFDGLLKGASGALDAFGELPDGVQQTAVALVGLGAAGLIAAPRIVDTISAMRDLSTMTAGARGALASASSVLMGPWGVAIAGGAALLGVFAAQQSGVKQETESWTRSLTFQGDQLDANGRKILAQQLAKEGLLDVVNELGMSEAAFLDVVQSGGPRLDALLDRIVDNESATKGLGDSQQEAAFGLDAFAQSAMGGASAQDGLSDSAKTAILRAQELNGQIGGVRQQTDLAAKAAGGAAVTQDDLNGVLADGTDVVAEYRKELDGLDGGYADVQEAQDNFHAAIDGVTASLKENGATLDGGTEKGRANREALRGMADKARDLAEATLQQTGSQDQANAKLQRGREELVKAGIRFGLTKKEAEAYATQLGLIPKTVNTKATLNVKAKSSLQPWMERILKAADAGDGSTVYLAPPNASGRVMARAGGGSATGLTVFGERGPELVDLGPQRAFVHDAGQTSRMLRGTATSGASISITVDARGSIDPAAVEAAGYRGAQRALAEVLQEVRSS